MFCKKGVLKNFAKFTGKHLCQSLFFNKDAGWDLTQTSRSHQVTRSVYIRVFKTLKKRLCNRCFLVNFTKFLKGRYTEIFFFQGISWNIVSGSFHGTWNNFMKYFYFSIQHSGAAVQMCSVKKAFLEISQNSQENTCTRSLFFNKVAGLRPESLFLKKPQAQVFSCEFCGISNNIFLQNTSGGCFWTFIAYASISSIKKLCLQKKDIV